MTGSGRRFGWVSNLWRALAGVAFVAIPRQVGAETWEAHSGPTPPVVIAKPRLSYWTGTFDRPLRACLGGATCSPDVSSEVGMGGGVEARIHMTGPAFATVALALVRTFPEPALNAQVVVPLSLGVLVTWPSWPVRPLFGASATPILYVTDDARDYTLGVRVGFEASVLGLVVGIDSTRHFAKTFEGTEVSISLGAH